MARFIALLRAVNVGGRKVPMSELRAICEKIGWKGVRTYIQSGNLVFDANGEPNALESALEQALAGKYGFDVPVMVRSESAWKAHAQANPFREASEKEPNRVLIGLSKQALKAGSAEAIEAKARAGERVAEAGGALWFHYPAGAGTSKLTPALIDRAAGSPVTARNWRTMTALIEMLE